ncbi:hypothetical protein MACH09_12980 [Vibrio sp. MACH09]|uniref:DUF2913 family protein n=1 Tax=Vibrio sp. MACH09 TaxID=3025122 RepID=UPI00278D9069|nr:DUF2913 family protein [Vibrio sp. MACH09]GLO60790.1 hypothetical protein MACH09_12980 [Vibrio sp. MACH09]
MTSYYIEIQNLVNTALKDVGEQHSKGKLINAPISNTHYMVRWVSKMLKAQTFDRCVLDDLKRWQKAGRSKGTQSELIFTFENISKFYAKHMPVDVEPKPILDSQIDAFLEQMYQLGWSYCTEDPVTDKFQVFTDGDNSLVLCANQCDDCFEGGSELVKPMSFYVRGNHAEFIEQATNAGFLLHKRTKYKSKVKYHGEYLVFPSNMGNQLAEIPLSFSQSNRM